MLSWAVENHDGVAVNHLTGFRRRLPLRSVRYRLAPRADRRLYGVAPVEIQRALIFALHTGQRQGDLLRLVWTSYDGSFIRLRQGKAKRRGVAGPPVEVPVTAALKRMLDGMPRVSATILTSRTGAAVQQAVLAEVWSTAASKFTREAGTGLISISTTCVGPP